MMKLSKESIVRIFCFLILLEGIACAVFLSFSQVRSTKLLVVVLFFCFLFLALGVWVNLSSRLQKRWIGYIDGFVIRKNAFRVASTICGFIFASAWLYLFALANPNKDTPALYILFRPIFIWLTFIVIQIEASLLFWRGISWPLPDPQKSSIRSGIIVLGIVSVLGWFIAFTRLGLDPVGNYWYSPGTPLLLAQVLFTFLLGILFSHLELRPGIQSGQSRLRLDILTAILLWGIAWTAWLSEPLARPTTFSPSPQAPNYEVYPYSDAAKSDVNAQNLLIGNNLSLNPQLKPLYSLFLVFLHGIAGQNYARMINIQVVILALIPILLYILGALFFNRSVGLITAFLLILRERNSIALSNIILVSHSKLFLTDVPATGLLILLVVLLIGWLKQPESRRIWPAVLGGVFGLFLVLRTQILIVIPFVVMAAGLVLFRRHRRLLLEGLLLILVGIMASTLPWVGYSYWSGSDVESVGYVRQLALQFRTDISEQIKPLPGESPEQYNARLQGDVIQFTFENPGYLVKSVLAYFFHNLVQSVAYLPQSPNLETSVIEYAKRMPFWDNWAGILPRESQSIFFLNLLLLSVGIGTAWARFRFLGMVPIFVYIGYVVSLSVPMISGWRFIMPVDWIVAFYYAMGFMEFVLLLRYIFSRKRAEFNGYNIVENGSLPVKFFWSRLWIVLAFFVLLNSSLPISKWLIPAQYPDLSQDQLIDLYGITKNQATNINLPSIQAVVSFLKQENSVVTYGKALYPRFLASGFGMRGGWASFSAREYSRLGFYLIGSSEENIVLPMKKAPASFPHGSNVWILGCRREPNAFSKTYIEAWIVIVHAHDDIYLLRSPWSKLNCSSE
jgi:hypothetical protein